MLHGVQGPRVTRREPAQVWCPLPSALYSWHYVNLEDARKHGWSASPGSRWGTGWLCSHHAEAIAALPEVSHMWCDGLGAAPRLVK